MSEPIKKPIQANPESYSPKIPEILSMAEQSNKPVEKLVKTITYKGAEFEIVERSDVLWVGCVDYADNNIDESDIQATLNRYGKELIDVPKRDIINPDYTGVLSINYIYKDKPCGVMFAQETYSEKQDERYDLFTQLGGLWLRISANKETDDMFFGRKSHGLFEYFGVLKEAAEENGYTQNLDIPLAIEYHCQAEHDTSPHRQFAYIPIVKL